MPLIESKVMMMISMVHQEVINIKIRVEDNRINSNRDNSLLVNSNNNMVVAEEDTMMVTTINTMTATAEEEDMREIINNRTNNIIKEMEEMEIWTKEDVSSS